MSSFKPNIDKPMEGLPVTKFRGRLKEYTLESREKGSDRIKFDFVDDLEILETREPWPFPFVSVNIAYQTNDSGKPRSKSRWAYFAESCGAVLPERDIDLLVGKLQTWEQKEEMIPAPARDENGVEIEGARWTDQLIPCWHVTWVEGYADEGGVSLMDYLAEMAIDKTDETFMQAMLTDSKARSMAGFSEAVTMMTDRKLLGVLPGIKKNPEGVWEKA